MNTNIPIQRKDKKLFSIEILTIAYCLITTFIVAALWQKIDNPLVFLRVRVLVIAAVLAIYYGAWLLKFPKFTSFIRLVLPLGMLSYWYSETYEFNKIFPNLDSLFATMEQRIFGFQPALVFAEYFPSKWISEAFHMGYFLYFPMMVGILLYCFFYRRAKFNQLGFIFLGSFFLYYLIFIFVPVAGPQFYFHAIGMENVQYGIFPNVGSYFRYNSELLPGPGYENGLFYRLVEMSQSMGERPTAAFPSSHVGISTILMIWLYADNKKLFTFLLPAYALLCGATVYIQAHYLIDVFAGWISAFAFYYGLYFAFDKTKIGAEMHPVFSGYSYPAR